MTKYCSKHPNAPHGFNRSASHSADRYVCDCESWKEPVVKDSLTVQKPLSDEIIRNIDVGVVENCGDDPWMEFARAIEKAHGIG